MILVKTIHALLSKSRVLSMIGMPFCFMIPFINMVQHCVTFNLLHAHSVIA